MPSHIAYGIFDLIHKLTATTSIADTWSVYMAAVQRAGFQFGIACFLPDDKSIGETTFANSYPTNWLENYVREGYQDHDPIIHRNHGATAPFTWSMSDYDSRELTTNQLLWRADNRSAGIETGFNIPDRQDGHLKCISVCGMPGKIDPDDLRTLHYAGLETLLRMHELGLQSAAALTVALSPRERECLQWIVAGKSDWEIGQILSISEKTVNTHVERAKHKMGVNTRAQVIVTALRRHLINP